MLYTTSRARTNVLYPRQGYEELDEWGIVAKMRHDYVVDAHTATPLTDGAAYMRAVHDAVFSPTRWKDRFAALNPDIPKAWIAAAIIWYHGSKPIITETSVFSSGYACE